MPKILEHAKNILRLRRMRRTLFWMLYKVIEMLNVSRSADVRQCNTYVLYKYSSF